MRAKFFLLVFIFVTQLLCAQQKTLTRIAFGSCSKESDPDQLWQEVVKEKPDLWIWMGDNIYADTYDMEVMKQKYDRQKSHPGYQNLLSLCPVIGTWDDHDYGLNDGGKDYTMKRESKDLLLDFLDVPAEDDVRNHEGVYSSYTYGNGKEKIKIILLDTRYFRDSLNVTSGKKAIRPNATGDILGEEQWAWLEQELSNSDAALHIIGSSIQFIPTQQVFEKWANFTTARERMLALLGKVKPKNTFFISGDRHIAEISKMEVDDLHYPIYDFTSSGLTHTWVSGWEENQYRIGDMIKQKNYGIIRIDWSKKHVRVTMQVKGKNNITYLQHVVQYPR